MNENETYYTVTFNKHFNTLLCYKHMEDFYRFINCLKQLLSFLDCLAKICFKLGAVWPALVQLIVGFCK